MGRKISWVILWLAPYLVSGFSAPLIFKKAPTPQIGGHYAGALFIFAVIWATLVSLRHHFPVSARLYLAIFALLTVLFWAWRFYNGVPLAQAKLLGIGGGVWHGVLTTMYLIGALILGYFEWGRAP